jgi:uncharacterized protein (DUF1501 family)
MARSCSCSDFNRSQLLHGAVARAGRGLPAIEPGQPTPAGTGMTRRSLLLRGAGAALSVYGASLFSPRQFEEGIAAAAAAAPNQPVLVSIFMQGGWDALSVLAPVGDPNYASLRPNVNVTAGSGPTFSEDSRLMWNPAAAGLATLHDEGKVTTFPAIGYDPPDDSHFTSRHYWEVGQLDASLTTGWMGRFLDATGRPDNPLQGLSLDSSLSPALATSSVPVAAVYSPSDYQLWAWGVDSPLDEAAMATFGQLGSLPAASPAFAQARTAARNTSLVLNQMAGFVSPNGTPNYNSPVTYPTAGGDFPGQLAALAAMLASGLPITCASLNGVGSYDTHSDESGTLTTNLGQTVAAVLAFQRDLEARGIADRVLVQLWSEFGRRPQDNGSGTDHGAAGAAFLIGTRASGVMVGEFPGLSALDVNDNLVNTSDFRALYCSLLEQWFATDASVVLPDAAKYARPTLLKS